MRLAYTTDDKIELAVSFDRWDLGDGAGRAQWKWTISADGTELAAGDDLRGANDGRAEAGRALASLGSFLAAWDEAKYTERAGRTSENADLFPAHLRDLSTDWEHVAYELADALGQNDD